MLMRHVFYGAASAASLLAAYFIVLSLLNSSAHAVAQFYEIWPWMLALVIGFGVQASLFFYMRSCKKTAAASTAVSSGSMVACCAHHAADALPLIGFAALAAFLDAYQKFFISLGIISNMLGTLFMLRCLQHGISTKNRMLKKIMNHDLKTAMEIASVLGAAFLAAVFLSI